MSSNSLENGTPSALRSRLAVGTVSIAPLWRSPSPVGEGRGEGQLKQYRRQLAAVLRHQPFLVRGHLEDVEHLSPPDIGVEAAVAPCDFVELLESGREVALRDVE